MDAAPARAAAARPAAAAIGWPAAAASLATAATAALGEVVAGLAGGLGAATAAAAVAGRLSPCTPNPSRITTSSGCLPWKLISWSRKSAYFCGLPNRYGNHAQVHRGGDQRDLEREARPRWWRRSRRSACSGSRRHRRHVRIEDVLSEEEVAGRVAVGPGAGGRRAAWRTPAARPAGLARRRCHRRALVLRLRWRTGKSRLQVAEAARLLGRRRPARWSSRPPPASRADPRAGAGRARHRPAEPAGAGQALRGRPLGASASVP